LSGSAKRKCAADVKGADEKVRPLATARFDKPWQDRQTLLPSASRLRATASRRLAHGFRGVPKIMKDEDNVR
jgi:hypothetical protein